MVTAQKITANTSWYLLALIFQKLFSFIYFTLLARHLGAEHLGQYYFAISFATMFAVISDLGLSSVLIREIAKQQIDQKKLFKQIFTLKLIFSLLTALVVIILDLILYSQDAVRPLIYLTTLVVIIDSFTLLFYGFIRGQQNLFYESIGTMVFQTIIVVFGLLLMQSTQQVYPFILVVLLASFFNLFYSSSFLLKKYQVRLQWYFDRALIKNIYLITWPFALSALFAKVYAYVDTFILKQLQGSVAVGYYSVAYKITFAFQFIPMAFVAALYPAFAHYWQEDKDQLKNTLVKAIHYLAFISLPLALGIVTVAPAVIDQIYTKNYASSIFPLQILIISLPFLFINFALSYFLNATDRQIINTRNLGITMIINVVLNIILIKNYAALGASLASSLSTIFLFSLDLWAVRRVTSLPIKVWQPVMTSLLASLIMALSVYYTQYFMPWILSIFVGIIIYLVLMVIFGNFKKSDLLFIKGALKRA